jgi:16S rRNA (cytosine967-C5)-methyltransferase
VDVGTPPAGVAARRAAWRALQLVRQGTPLEVALEQALAGLPDPDRRLAHELAAGTLRTAGALDRAIAPWVKGGMERVTAEIRDLLRLGTYQLTALDRVPPHAAVSTAVTLAGESSQPKAAAFVNAVLRRVSESAPRTVPGRSTHPGWLVTRWSACFGAAGAAALQQWNDTRPRLVIQPARWTSDQLEAAWRAAGVEFDVAPHDAGLMPALSRPDRLPGYAEGGFIVQDAAQALVTRFCGVSRDAIVYDACAAPGGKTIALGRDARRVIAADLRLERVRRLHDNLRRAGGGNEFVVVADAAAPPVRPVDAVLLDAPCSGTGVFARHPDARWRVRPEAIARLAAQAARLLAASAGRVTPGGLLCFSTCSLEPEENEMQIEAFLAADGRFRREPGPAPAELLSPAGDLVIVPHRDAMDGAYAARLRRVA